MNIPAFCVARTADYQVPIQLTCHPTAFYVSAVKWSRPPTGKVSRVNAPLAHIWRRTPRDPFQCNASGVNARWNWSVSALNPFIRCSKTCVLPAMTYGTWTLTEQAQNKLAAAQTKMERSMLNITHKDRRTNMCVRQRTNSLLAIKRNTWKQEHNRH